MVTFGQFGKHHLLVKTAVASFWATFGKVWGIFIQHLVTLMVSLHCLILDLLTLIYFHD